MDSRKPNTVSNNGEKRSSGSARPVSAITSTTAPLRRSSSSSCLSDVKDGLAEQAIEAVETLRAEQQQRAFFGYDKSLADRVQDGTGGFGGIGRSSGTHHRPGKTDGDAKGGSGNSEKDPSHHEDENKPLTVADRLDSTLCDAKQQFLYTLKRAKWWSSSINVAITLQVIVSAVITILSAVTSGRTTSTCTAVLGGVGTVIASIVARARGAGQPEAAVSNSRDLAKFVRRCEAFLQDHGKENESARLLAGEDPEPVAQHASKHALWLDKRIEELRKEFEDLVGEAKERQGQSAKAPV